MTMIHILRHYINLNSLNTGSLIGHFHLFQGHRIFAQKEEFYCIFLGCFLFERSNIKDKYQVQAQGD